MELSQLRYFKKVAECGSLTKAAEELFISAPTLSASIARLEKEIGVPLFDRIRQRIYLNNNGRNFYNAVCSGIQSLDEGLLMTRENALVTNNTLSIATTNQTLWNCLICDFLHQYPEVKLIHQLVKRESLTHLDILNQFDFIFSYDFSISFTGFNHAPLFQDDCVYVCLPQSHPLAKKKEIELIELKDEPLLFPPASPWLNSSYYSICREAGFEPKVVAECGYVLMTYLFNHGLGIMFANEHSDIYGVSPYTAVIPLKDVSLPQMRSQAIFWHEKRQLSTTAQLFKDYTLNYYQNRKSPLSNE